MVAGDCMVVAMDMSGNDHFGIVLLAPLGPTQTLHITDDGWSISQNMFNTATATKAYSYYESHQTYTATEFVPAGTVLTKADFLAPLDFGNTVDQNLEAVLSGRRGCLKPPRQPPFGAR